MNNSFPSAFVNKFRVDKYYEMGNQTSKRKYSRMSKYTLKKCVLLDTTLKTAHESPEM